MADDDTDRAWAEQLVALEETLWRTATRFDRPWMERVLHPDFHEFGRSGRRWSRAEILGMPAGQITVAWPPRHLSVRLVSPGVALLTYVVVGADGAASNRSSLWLHEGVGEAGGRSDAACGSAWRLRFHQGGPTAV